MSSRQCAAFAFAFSTEFKVADHNESRGANSKVGLPVISPADLLAH